MAANFVAIWSVTMSENPTVAHPTSRHLLRAVIVAAVLLIAVLVGIAGYVQNWLWMRQLNYVGIFWTLLSVQWAMFCSAFVVAFLYLWMNLRQAAKNSGALRGQAGPWSPVFLSRADAGTQTSIELSAGLLKAAVVLVSAGVALFFAASYYSEWDTYLRFRYGGSFGVADPLFGVDVGFYVFHLCLSPALLCPVAKQPDVPDGVDARDRPFYLRVLGITAGKRERKDRDRR
jgi:uncharacterized membrane protein (UPF0182 family)